MQKLRLFSVKLKSRAARHVYIYLFSYFFNAAISFLTVSVLTHKLSTYDYGIINLYSSFLIFLAPFVTGGILYPLSVEYFKRSENEYRDFFTNSQVISLLGLFVFTILCVAFQNPLSNFLKVGNWWVMILPLTAWWILINETILMICRNKNKPVNFAAFSIGKNALEILLTIALVIGLGMTWPGRLLSAAIAPLILGLICIYFIYKWHLVAPSVNWKSVRAILWLSVPFIFERLSIFILSASDRYFIDQFDNRSTNEVGIYSLGAQMAAIIQLVIMSIVSAYNPLIFKQLAAGDVKKASYYTQLYIGALVIVIIGFVVALPLLFRYFIGDDFSRGQYYASFLCIAYFFWGVYTAFLPYLLFHRKNNVILLISLVGMIFSLVLNSVLVQDLGAKGALYTSVSVYFIMAVIAFFICRRFLKTQYA